jgi:hypothetical protein
MHNICPLQPQPVFDSTITYDNDMLSAQFGADTYQWFNCISGLPLSGENSAALSPVPPGSYRAELSFGGCNYSTACFTVTNSEKLSKNKFSIIPNPNRGSFWVNFEESGTAVIYNIQGLKVFDKQVDSPQQIDLQDLPKGLYILSFNGETLKFLLY